MIHKASRTRALVAAAIVVFAAPSCSLDPTRLPVPGAYQPTSSYLVNIEFSSVLNLPARAKVDFGGIQVGVLDSVRLNGSTAVATVEIENGTRLPENIRAELRQATILGDIYIALIPPATPAPSSLGNGDTVPLSNTAPADNVEDLLRSSSNLVSGGALGTMQDTVINLNKAFPKDPAELTRLQHKLSGVLHDLATNQDTIDRLITNASNIGNSLAANTHTFDRLITEGPPKLEGLGSVTLNIVNLIFEFAYLSRPLQPWLHPLTADVIDILKNTTPFIARVSTADTTVPVIADKLVDLVRDRLIPFFGNGGPKYTVSELHAPDGSIGKDPAVVDPPTPTQQANDAISLMQTTGMMP